MRRYMVIETFRPGCRAAVYARFAAQGRLLPDGLLFIDRWLEAEGDRCFQLMETADAALFDAWIARWSDLVDFEVVPVALE